MTLHDKVLTGKTAEEMLGFIEPYLDRMESAHKASLEKLIMEAPDKSARIVAHTQAVRSFKILRGMITATIADAATAAKILQDAERLGKVSETERRFLGIKIPD
jgi:hypothetical protein